MTVAATGKTDNEKKDYYPQRRPKNDWTGSKQFRLEFTSPAYYVSNGTGGTWFYNVKCACGKTNTIAARRSTQSCGCLKTERVQEFNRNRAAFVRNEKPQVKKVAFDYSRCHSGYAPCDNIHNLGEMVPPACFGDKCYVNAHLAIGI